MEQIAFRPIEEKDYEQLYHLWNSNPGVGLSEADSPDSIASYLEQNRGSSLAAFSGETLVGSILAGDDGRRGYLHHLVVHSDFRKRGIGRKLVGEAVLRLKRRGIGKCHIFIFTDNEEGIEFWKSIGWDYREDIAVMSFTPDETGQMSGSDKPRTC
jgi:putative acetyltransferase